MFGVRTSTVTIITEIFINIKSIYEYGVLSYSIIKTVPETFASPNLQYMHKVIWNL